MDKIAIVAVIIVLFLIVGTAAQIAVHHVQAAL